MSVSVHNNIRRIVANFLLQMHRKFLFRCEANRAIGAFRFDFEVGKFVPLQIKFIFKRQVAFAASEIQMLLHVKH